MLRLAIIGFGVMGGNHHRVLAAMEGVEVVAVCDPRLSSGDLPQRVHAEHRKMLAEERLDAAIVATPTCCHMEISLDCMRQGLHLLIEKPVTATIEDARRVAEAARQAGARVGVGYVERFNPVVAALKNELRGKEILSLNITRVGPFPPRIADVGVLTDLAVHDIDLIRFITGKEILEKRIFKSRKFHHHHEDNAILSFELEDAVVAGVTTNWLTPFKKRKIEVATREAYYEANLMTQELKEFSAYKANNSFVIRNCCTRREEPLLNELTAFARLVETGDRGHFATIQDSLRTLEIIDC